MKNIEIVISQDKSWVRLSEYQRLQQENEHLKAQIEKMRCCENCKYHSFWGDELKCNYGTKEALQEGKLVECKDMNKWELAE